MPRIRSVHPDLCRDDVLAQASAEAERTFVRLWPHLDDDGRAVDDPRLIKADLYPLHDHVTADDVDRDLAELADLGLVIRYQVAGRRYLTAKPDAWPRYQKPRRPVPSKYPPPPPNTDGTPPDNVRTRSDNVGRIGPEARNPGVPDNVRTPPDKCAPEGSRRGVGVGGEQEQEGECEGEGPTGDHAPPRLTPRQRDEVLDQAIELLTERALATTPSRGNPAAHRAAIRRGKRTDHHQAAHQHLVADPTLTPDRLAQLLEPVAPGPVARPDPLDATQAATRALAERNRLRLVGEACPSCHGTGWVEDTDADPADWQVTPCPTCHAEAAS